MNIESINPLDEFRLQMSRRHFFSRCGLGLGTAALAALLKEDGLAAGPAEGVATQSGGLPDVPHFAPKAKRVIYLFQSGGPSQLELFDHKPQLQELNGKPIPESYIKGKRFAFMNTFAKEVPKLLGTRRKFGRYGQSGAEISE